MVARNNQQEALRAIGQSHSFTVPRRRCGAHDEEQVVGDPKVRTIIAANKRSYVYLSEWASSSSTETTVRSNLTCYICAFLTCVNQNVLGKLATHCAMRLVASLPPDQVPDLESVAQEIVIKHNRVYSHKRLRLNYTTYDVQRAQDTITVGTDKCDIMLLSNDADAETEQTAFRYARVLRVLTVYVVHPTLAPTPLRIELLWVRRFRSISSPSVDWDRALLEKVAFVPSCEDHAFGFLAPGEILRAAHIIPCFRDGRTKTLLGPTEFRRDEEGEWASHYIAMYVVIHGPEHTHTR
jgi:hypothetical protein